MRERKSNMSRPTVSPHFDSVVNGKTFDNAYASVGQTVGKVYQTTGGKDFVATSSVASKGPHKGEKVIIFKQSGKEMARVCPCCWGKRTNCNRTYIDSYTPFI